MKSIFCTKCGDEIQSGYAVNPENSAICNTCYIEESEEMKEKLGLTDKGEIGD